MYHQISGADQWGRAVGQSSGAEQWGRAVGQSSGAEQWGRAVGQSSGAEQWGRAVGQSRADEGNKGIECGRANSNYSKLQGLIDTITKMIS